MLKIICPNCDKENIFQSRGNMPSECSFCFTSFPSTITISEIADGSREITGLTIIYQINQQRLEISTLHKTILGRENFGAAVFSKIFFNGKPVVSRKHCSIEFTDGKFYLLDEGSLNGTFYSVNKISCKTSPQVIEDKSIFYIGEEAFLAQINFKEEAKKVEVVTPTKEEETKAIKVYRCNESGCGYETQSFISVCPNCSTYNSLIPIYE
jgi:pSer/pThr/pTyr-binding forkhead associated (FHA) protein